MTGSKLDLPTEIALVVAEHPGETRTQVMRRVMQRVDRVSEADVLSVMPIQSTATLRVEPISPTKWRYWPRDQED